MAGRPTLPLKGGGEKGVSPLYVTQYRGALILFETAGP